MKETKKAPHKTTAITPGHKPNGDFALGNCANPGGRPKGLAKLVRERTHDNADQVEFFQKLASGKEVFGFKPNLDQIIEANKWLTDRGHGKAPQVVVGDEDGGPLRNLHEVPPDLLTALASISTALLKTRFTE